MKIKNNYWTEPTYYLSRYVAPDGEILDEIHHGRAGEYSVKSTGKRYTELKFAKRAVEKKFGGGAE